MLVKNTAFYKRFKQLCKFDYTAPICPQCKKKMTLEESDNVHYVKTVSREIFIHEECLKNFKDFK